MIRTTDRPIFLVRVGSLCGGIWWGLEDEQVIRISRGREKGVEIERRKGELWNENIYERVLFFQRISWQYLQHLKSYSMGCHFENE